MLKHYKYLYVVNYFLLLHIYLLIFSPVRTGFLQKLNVGQKVISFFLTIKQA